jgi:hypothetical protein
MNLAEPRTELRSAGLSLSTEGAIGIETYVLIKDGPTVSRLTADGTKSPMPELSSATTPAGLQIADSSTLPVPDVESRLLNEYLHDLFLSALDEEFEDGVESKFSTGLVDFVRRYGEQAIKLLSGFIQNKTVNAESAAEALRWIGRMHDPITFRYRVWLLGLCLSARSLRVRDGAVLGLAFMDSTKTIPVLEAAVINEPSKELKQDMQHLLDHLRARKSRAQAA